MGKANLDVGLIKRLMKDKGLGPADVGYRMGVSSDMVRGWLNTGEASMERAVQLAGVLGVTIVHITVAA